MSSEIAVMGVRMRNAPIYFTVVQARFNPILTLETVIPVIQDRLRLKGFPDYQKLITPTFSLNLVGGQQPQMMPSSLVQYTFGNTERTSKFALDQGSLSLQMTEYDVFETFSGLFLEGLAIIHEAVQLGYTDRVGIRYLDAVLPAPGEELDAYLATSVHGLLRGIDGEIAYTFSETRAQHGALAVVARTVTQNGKVGFPPDLQPTSLLVADRFRSYEGRHAILDTDASHEHRDPFNLPHLKDVLSKVHSVITQAFKASVTPMALETWQ